MSCTQAFLKKSVLFCSVHKSGCQFMAARALGHNTAVSEEGE